MILLTERIMTTGVPVKLYGRVDLEQLLRRLGGQCVEVTNDTMVLGFPDQTAAAIYRKEAERRGAFFADDVPL